MSNRAWFKYCWIWEKAQTTGHLDANRKPLKAHEDIAVFCDGSTRYIPQISAKPIENIRPVSRRGASSCYGSFDLKADRLIGVDCSYPKSVLKFSNQTGLHPTQKPIALLEYLIKTYTNEGDMLLDNTCGSGTALVAARNTNRRAVGIEMDEGYCRIAAGRLGRFEPSEFEVDKKAVDGQLGLFGAIA